jgi:hypothetical protein
MEISLKLSISHRSRAKLRTSCSALMHSRLRTAKRVFSATMCLPSVSARRVSGEAGNSPDRKVDRVASARHAFGELAPYLSTPPNRAKDSRSIKKE